jgi:predicted extracellular nuclease
MNRPLFIALAALTSIAGCGSSSGGTTPDSGTDSHGGTDTGSPLDTGGPIDSGHDSGTPTDSGSDAGTGMTIAKARAGNITTPITVDAIVTAMSGAPGDNTDTYIEDPAGGMLSGIVVYCDHDNGCELALPLAIGDLAEVTGSISSYMGQLQIVPTAITVLKKGVSLPPIATVTMEDIAPGANSPYRGVLVKLALSGKLTVDNVNPAALFNTSCGSVPPDAGAADAGGKKGKDAGGGEGGLSLPQCSPLCEPPVYSGFRANDGMGNEAYIEATFFSTDPLQSSPECLTQPGVVPVTVGDTFSSMTGVLDYDGYGSVQELSPVTTSDYTMP